MGVSCGDLSPGQQRQRGLIVAVQIVMVQGVQDDQLPIRLNQGNGPMKPPAEIGAVSVDVGEQIGVGGVVG